MDLQLHGKRALVTGATRGIGLRIAQILAGEGCDIAICARQADDVERTVEKLRTFGVKCWGGTLDLADGDSISQWVEGAAEALGGVDILILNASAMALGTTIEDWIALFQIDILSAVKLVEAAVPFLEKATDSSGAITFISSISAVETTRVMPYGAIKAALNHYAKGLAYDLAPKGIRVNVVAPGQVYFEGGLWERIKDARPEYYEAMIQQNPTKRFATPEEIADMTCFLSSPRSSFTTGTVTVVDGTVTRRTS